MDWEAALITKVLKKRDIATPIRQNITVEHFYDSQYRIIWEYLLTHYQDPNKKGVPTLKYIKSKFGDKFDPEPSKDNIGSIIERVKEKRAYKELREALEACNALAPTDALKAVEDLSNKLMTIKGRNMTVEVIDTTEDLDEARADYERAEACDGIVGIPYPWEQLTKDTGGAVGGDLITIAGRPGTLKSWYTFYVADHWHSEGRKGAIFTKELPPKAIKRRLLSIHNQMSDHDVRRGSLPPQLRQDFMDNMESYAERVPLRVTRLTKTGIAAIMEVQALVEIFEPEWIEIDGFYFIGERDPFVTATCLSMLKDLLMAWGIPGFINTQLNQEHDKQKEKYFTTSGGAYGDAYAQDSDLFIKIRQNQEDRAMKEVLFIPAKVREGVGRPFAASALPAWNLGQKYVLQGDEEASFIENTVEGSGIIHG